LEYQKPRFGLYEKTKIRLHYLISQQVLCNMQNQTDNEQNKEKNTNTKE
jgi:hypothetical protein